MKGGGFVRKRKIERSLGGGRGVVGLKSEQVRTRGEGESKKIYANVIIEWSLML